MPQLRGHGSHAPWALWAVLALLGLWRNQVNMRRTKIEPDSPVEVLFTRRERDLVIEETFAGQNLTERLRMAAVAGTKLAVRYTLDDLDELVGRVAAAANHAEDAKLRKALDALFVRLTREMASYDVGGNTR